MESATPEEKENSISMGRGDKRIEHCYTPETVSDTLPAASDAVSLADWR
jgi:hypothetical protein